MVEAGPEPGARACQARGIKLLAQGHTAGRDWKQVPQCPPDPTSLLSGPCLPTLQSWLTAWPQEKKST